MIEALLWVIFFSFIGWVIGSAISDAWANADSAGSCRAGEPTAGGIRENSRRRQTRGRNRNMTQFSSAKHSPSFASPEVGFAQLMGQGDRTARGWVLGERTIPGPLHRGCVLRLMPGR